MALFFVSLINRVILDSMQLITRLSYLKLVFVFLLLCPVLNGQNCIGGAISTEETFLYGRFEVRMRSAAGDGVVSSFFLYHLNVGCNWPEENNEIDIEMTGNAEDVIFTTHYPDLSYLSEYYSPEFNPHEGLQDYAFEWEPGIVRWFVNDELIYVQEQDFVAQLIHPMNVVMNLWASENENWTGPWDPSIMPLDSQYDYVKCYNYTPGNGNTGTNNNFTLAWEDHFDTLDLDRWNISEFDGFGNNHCEFRSSSVEVENGYLYLQLEEPPASLPDVPVTIAVDLREQNLEASDQIYLNGTFNDWCGNCAPMTNNNGIWTRTIHLPPGKYEYLFTKNLWEENGGAPLGSECDYNPCDEYTNYGIIVSLDSPPIAIEPPCWGDCGPCLSTNVFTPFDQKKRALLKIYDQLGREANEELGKLLFYHFDDGSIEKRIIWEH
jgi:hypothetical protein